MELKRLIIIDLNNPDKIEVTMAPDINKLEALGAAEKFRQSLQNSEQLHYNFTTLQLLNQIFQLFKRALPTEE